MNVLEVIIRRVKALIPYKMQYLFRRKRIEKYLKMEVHITEHCNLNCKGCFHFSCIANKEFLSLNVFESNLKRLSELTRKLPEIVLLGGEPLLHPQICSFIVTSRNYFPNTLIKILTNGILLEKQSNKFWSTCKDNNVIISISLYPINIDFKNIERIAMEQKVHLIYDEDYTKTYSHISDKHTMYKWYLDIAGKQNYIKNYNNCRHKGGLCITLRDGKLYPCCTVAHIIFFNRMFNKNLDVTDRDYIDIYKTDSIDDVYDFMIKPFPFCRYCIPLKQHTVDWSVTKKEITEWT